MQLQVFPVEIYLSNYIYICFDAVLRVYVVMFTEICAGAIQYITYDLNAVAASTRYLYGPCLGIIQLYCVMPSPRIAIYNLI